MDGLTDHLQTGYIIDDSVALLRTPEKHSFQQHLVMIEIATEQSNAC